MTRSVSIGICFAGISTEFIRSVRCELQGHVANEVETEQIVHSGLLTAFPPPGRPGYTSFVQHRGSIPLFWSQDASNLTPKPPIGIDRRDPFYEAAAKHFNWMMDRYGGPVVVLNLVKMREAVPRESLVGNELANAISYLNQFLPDELRIEHVPWDMARALKSEGDVIAVLEGIAEKEVEKTGFFRSGPEPFVDLSSDATVRDEGALQQGVTRTNCIDCLDRTNAAQFVIAKCALGHQVSLAKTPVRSNSILIQTCSPALCSGRAFDTAPFFRHRHCACSQYYISRSR